MIWLYIALGCIALIIIACMFAWYRVVPPSEAHLVVTPNKRMVCSSDPDIRKNGGTSQYFAIPEIPFIGRKIRILDLTTKEIIGEMETYETNNARYGVRYSLKYRITDVETAAERFITQKEMEDQLKEITQASVRAVTVEFDVVQARANKKKISERISDEISDDLAQWGLKLINFVLVDFKDTPESKIISNISRRREVEIESETRQQNAEKIKVARMKEAESDELALKREIARDQEVLRAAQDKDKFVAEKEKDAKMAHYEVVQVEKIREAEIAKKKALVDANRDKEVETIVKERKKLDGEGQRLYLEELAKGEAAKIRESGFAEAEAKDKLQAALNKFKEDAIRALVAEQIVAKDKEVGIKTAEALQKANIKLFSGDGAKPGFDLGKLISAASVADESTSEALLNKLARPNDMGLTALGLNKVKEMSVENKSESGNKKD